MGIAPAAATAANGNAQTPDGIDALSQKTSAFTSADADNAIASTTSNAPAVADGSVSASSNGDNPQTFAAGLAAINHASVPAAADNGSQNPPDLSALGNLTATASAVPTGATAGAAHNLATNATVGSSAFAKELGQHITWLSGQDVKQAQIRLNPQDLGPLDVKVSVEHGRVDVSFITQHAATTTAVQQGLDQLHQMLSGQGLSLGHATVGQHAQQQPGAQQGQQSAGNTNDEAVADTPVAAATRVAVGLVDAFA
jgi:flagellar hook-length control protein FliK